LVGAVKFGRGREVLTPVVETSSEVEISFSGENRARSGGAGMRPSNVTAQSARATISADSEICEDSVHAFSTSVPSVPVTGLSKLCATVCSGCNRYLLQSIA
jgi:hypothetical protein